MESEVADSAEQIMEDYQLAVALYWKDNKARLVEMNAECVRRINSLARQTSEPERVGAHVVIGNILYRVLATGVCMKMGCSVPPQTVLIRDYGTPHVTYYRLHAGDGEPVGVMTCRECGGEIALVVGLFGVGRRVACMPDGGCMRTTHWHLTEKAAWREWRRTPTVTVVVQ